MSSRESLTVTVLAAIAGLMLLIAMARICREHLILPHSNAPLSPAVLPIMQGATE